MTFTRIGDLIMLVLYIKNDLKFSLNSIKFKSKLSIFQPQGLGRRKQLSVNFGNNKETFIKVCRSQGCVTMIKNNINRRL